MNCWIVATVIWMISAVLFWPHSWLLQKVLWTSTWSHHWDIWSRLRTFNIFVNVDTMMLWRVMMRTERLLVMKNRTLFGSFWSSLIKHDDRISLRGNKLAWGKIGAKMPISSSSTNGMTQLVNINSQGHSFSTTTILIMMMFLRNPIFLFLLDFLGFKLLNINLLGKYLFPHFLDADLHILHFFLQLLHLFTLLIESFVQSIMFPLDLSELFLQFTILLYTLIQLLTLHLQLLI